MIAQGVAVFVMDIGASYKNICELLGGEMLRFDRGSKLSLNPFAGLSSSGAVYTKALSLLAQGVDFKKVADITGLPEEKIEALAVGKSAASNLEKEKEGIEVLEIKDKKISGKTHFVTKDSMIYAKAMVASMCGLSGDVRGEAVIERAIAEGIAEYGTDLDITKLAKVFEELKDHRGNPVAGASAMSDSLYPYTEQGIHGRYFKSGKEASFKEMLTLFELEEIKDDEPLLAVVLQIILMQITMQFLCGDRSRYFMLVVDEAWLIMDFAASFLERFARTVRKYGGSLVVCTQDLSSFSKGPSQRAILESSTWKLILQQKEEGITTFAKEEGYLPYLDLIRSVRKCSANRFSEILIDTNGAKVVGRLVTDPYSTALYSTEKDDFSFLINQEKAGKSKHEAILQLSKKYGSVAEDFRYVEKE
jgi:type IV secretory pathway VirB4 component